VLQRSVRRSNQLYVLQHRLLLLQLHGLQARPPLRKSFTFSASSFTALQHDASSALTRVGESLAVP
jgi:hypothetical protein